ncbi:hypothetical protein TWF730_003883 [Orbilia blumenaviensis]|uniref:Uncharacterized protein n=1 Tax=Orbilia blumenaviensis TaxID=1796055 RepID=A0AAV9U574_9PEZI
MEMLASDIHHIPMPGSSLDLRASPSIQTPTLEMRVIALETKLRHHKPEHPCDCKYELSLLEEKLGGLDEHPWELRISEVERKQRRDARDVSRLWKDLRECQDRTETLMAEHHWVSNQGKCVDQATKPTNSVYLIQQTIGKLQEFERFQEEFAACLIALKKRCDEMEGDIRHVQPWIIDQMVEKQENVADKIVRLNGDTKTLEDRVGELMTLKRIVAKQLEAISRSVDSKVSELEKTIADIVDQSARGGTREGDQISDTKLETQSPQASEERTGCSGNNAERKIWAPPTSVEPTHKPYTHGIPMVLEQPEGWGDVRAEVCRELEESQKVYFSSQQGFEKQGKEEYTDSEVIRGASLGRCSEESSISEPSSLKKKKRRRNRRSDSASRTCNSISEGNEPCVKIEGHQTDEDANPKAVVLAINECPQAPDPNQPATSAPIVTTRDPKVSPRDTDENAKFFKLLAKSNKSRQSPRKQRSRTIVKNKDKPKYISMTEVFKQGKGVSDGRGVGKKAILDTGTNSSPDVLTLR